MPVLIVLRIRYKGTVQIMDMKLIITHYGHLQRGLSKLNFIQWWRDQNNITDKLGLKLTHVMGGFLEIRDKLTQYKSYRLPRSQKRIMREIEDDNVEILALTSLITKDNGLLAYDWDFDAHFGKNITCDLVAIIGVDIRHLRKQNEKCVQDMIRESFFRDSTQLAINYGFSAIMERDALPTGYAVGMASLMPEYFVHDGFTWSQYAGKVCDRRLRNVFGYNVINRSHLDIKLGDQRLEEWIGESPSRGRIEILSDDLFAWTFARSKNDTDFLAWNYPPVEKVRRELEKFSIFPWQEVET